MIVKKKNKVLFLVTLASCCFAGCRSHYEENTAGIEQQQANLSSTELQDADSILLTKFNYQIEGEDIEKAKVHATQLSSPEGRAIAFLRIVLKGKQAISASTSKKEALNEAIQNLNSISNLAVKFALQQEFLTALSNLDPKHKEKTLTEAYLGILDNFWETSSALDANLMKLNSATISMINESLNKSWNLKASQLKMLGFEGKILTARLRYPLNPEKSQTEINTIKEQVWEINPPSNRIPFLLDLIEFEIDVTHDISEAKRLITTLKKTLEMHI